MAKEAKARILINDLLRRSGWRFFDDESGPANVTLETHVKLKKRSLDDLGNDFEKTANGYVDYLLLDEQGFPLAVLEAKSEKYDPLVGKEQARKYARSQNVRFVILSNGHLHYFWDLEQGNPALITEFPTRESLGHFDTFKPSPVSLINEHVEADYVAVTQNPVIHEYDTLTSEERWDERCDVILANPPFMTPKGGIRPHNRFSIKARRSEVLFADYIAEHLNPGGRAGVIVPEGIIFQSQNAYKNLRKMLVEDYLWAVVSLPAGVFNPYSSVKTSILLMDRNLAKRTKEILFVKIENDGFDCGAQRRPIEGSQLAEAQKLLLLWKRGRKRTKKNQGNLAHAVGRERILDSTDHSLSGERYRDRAASVNGKWPMVPIGEVCRLTNGRAFKPTDWEKGDSGGMPIIRIRNLNDRSATFNYYSKSVADKLIVSRGDLLFSWSGSRGTSFGPHIWDRDKGILNQHIFKVDPPTTVSRGYLYLALKKAVAEVEQNLHGGVGLVHITKGNLERILIPVPPLDIQETVVAEVDGYRKVIEGARQIIANYRPTIQIDPEWPTACIGDLCSKVQHGLSSALNTDGVGYRTLRMNEIVNGLAVDDGQMKRADISDSDFQKYRLTKGDVLFNRTNSYEHVGRTGIFLLDGDYVFASYLIRLVVDQEKARSSFLNWFMNTQQFQQGVKSLASRAIGQANINATNLRGYSIPLPPLDVQGQIVDQIETEQALVNSNHKLIEIYEQKIQAKLAEVWGEPSEVSAFDKGAADN